MSLSDAQIDQLKVLWCDEERSATEIAAIFQVTRSTIIGICHRRGFQKPKRLPVNPPRKKLRPLPVIAPEPDPPQAVAIDASEPIEDPEELPEPEPECIYTPITEAFGCEPVDSLNLPLSALKSHQCLWPTRRVDDQHLFCGRPAKGGGWMAGGWPYCEEHIAKGSGGLVSGKGLRREIGKAIHQ